MVIPLYFVDPDMKVPAIPGVHWRPRAATAGGVIALRHIGVSDLAMDHLARFESCGLNVARFNETIGSAPHKGWDRRLFDRRTACRSRLTIAMVETCGRSSMVERQLPKLHTRVRFPSPAPALSL